jgi:hypothetical protein
MISRGKRFDYLIDAATACQGEEAAQSGDP